MTILFHGEILWPDSGHPDQEKDMPVFNEKTKI